MGVEAVTVALALRVLLSSDMLVHKEELEVIISHTMQQITRPTMCLQL
jgi:hypothetical protein